MTENEMRAAIQHYKKICEDIGEPLSDAEINCFRAGYEAAQSQSTPNKEEDCSLGYFGVLKDQLLREQTRTQYFVNLLARITGYLKSDAIETPEGRFEYSPDDAVIRQNWDALTKAIKRAQTDALSTPQPNHTSEEEICLLIAKEASYWPDRSNIACATMIYRALVRAGIINGQNTKDGEV